MTDEENMLAFEMAASSNKNLTAPLLGGSGTSLFTYTDGDGIKHTKSPSDGTCQMPNCPSPAFW